MPTICYFVNRYKKRPSEELKKLKGAKSIYCGFNNREKLKVAEVLKFLIQHCDPNVEISFHDENTIYIYDYPKPSGYSMFLTKETMLIRKELNRVLDVYIDAHKDYKCYQK